MRIGYFLTHPIQYQSPMIRALVASGLDVHVGYGCQASGGRHLDPGFGHEIVWDTPLLEGYPYADLQVERGEKSTLGAFQAVKTKAAGWLRSIQAEAAWIHGWGNPFPKVPWFSLAAFWAARSLNLPILMRGETNDLCLRGNRIRRAAHGVFLRALFSRVSAFLAVGSANRDFYLRRGVQAEKISLMPYAVDNHFFQQRCAAASNDRDSLRAGLGISSDAVLLLFAGRLVEVKGIETLLRAFAAIRETDAHLLVAGEGPLRPALEARAGADAPGRVHFEGFRNQSELPAYYAACDLFVLPSDFEPWGLVVNEVMNAGKPVIVSDAVGAGLDLVKSGVNGNVFTAGNAADLRDKLLPWLRDAALRSRGGQESLRIINHWSFEEDVAGLKAVMPLLKKNQVHA